ncbi:MAG TPA: SDR family NAD(P)-dependent oxidoreductase [Ilumatobacteraceae bacterium]|jgi:NAD(P)-dependent dehydrogenase (short-subunit alcohol dehydrogenase family)|nr:SDR family NAD(P)-dependent oxidoreductase [Ilumatobacteraceae bacterium]
MDDLEGKVAVITGAGSGMGLGMARAFTGAGMRVVAAEIDQASLDRAVDELTAAGHEAVGVRTDVSKLADVEALAEAAMDHFGAVHVLCNNAGVCTFATIDKMSIEEWEWTLGIDLWGPIYGVKVFKPLIEQTGTGHINSTASVAGLIAGGAVAPYNVAKHGVVALMCTLERELRSAHSPVRASVLCPGAVNTPIGRNSQRSRRALRGETDAGAGIATGREAEKLNDRLGDALKDGMDPDEVGRMVLDAIRSDTFWILTNPGLAKQQHHQVAAMLEDRSLSRLRMF